MDCVMNVVKALGWDACLAMDDLEAIPLGPSSGVIVGKKRRKLGRKSSSADSKLDMLLHRVPGRMFLNGSSDVASLHSKQGTKGVKQDAMIVWENYGVVEDTIFCGVFDGHGPHGHLVAKKVRDTLPLKLHAQWELSRCSKHEFCNNGSNAVGDVKSEDFALLHVDRELKTNNQNMDTKADLLPVLKECFLKAFKVVDKELKLHPDIDCFTSGTTAVTLVKKGQHLVIGNVGDSRAILGTRDNNNRLKAVPLTVDLKPTLPKEAERIRRCKGRVFALPNEPHIARVWMPNANTPGLAMARALGDFCLKDFGLISIPEISYHHVADKDEFVVLATDGVWDVLSNKEVVEIVASSKKSDAARTVVESAVRTWKSRYPLARIDDCAVVCLFLNSGTDNKLISSATSEQTLASGQAGAENKNTAAVPSPVDVDDSGTNIMSSKQMKPDLGANDIGTEQQQ